MDSPVTWWEMDACAVAATATAVKGLMQLFGFGYVERALPVVYRTPERDAVTGGFVNMPHAHGCYDYENHIVVVGDWTTLPVLAHELCHAFQDRAKILNSRDGIVMEEYINSTGEQEAFSVQAAVKIGVELAMECHKIVPCENAAEVFDLMTWIRTVQVCGYRVPRQKHLGKKRLERFYNLVLQGGAS